MRTASAFAAVALALLPAPVAAQSVSTTIEEAAWLAGRWVGEGLGGQVEENWAPPAGGQMVGHFRLVRAGRPIFYELMLLDVHDGRLRMRVKHFGPDFAGWEERGGSVDFPFLSAARGDLSFDGLRYRLDGTTLIVTVRVRPEGNGPPEEVEFRFRRAPA